MSIAPGTRLGPCEIANAIGAGGMGDVYEPTPDGKRFAALYNNPLPSLTEIRVVTNGLRDLARVR